MCSASKRLTAQRKLIADPHPHRGEHLPPLHMTDHGVATKFKNSHFSQIYTMLVLKAKSTACVVASCEPVWGFSSFPDPNSLVHIKAATHLDLSSGRGQVDTRGLHFSSGGMSEGSEGLLDTRKCSPHFREINQSLEEQDCHFLGECWKISLAINLSRPGLVLAFISFL